MKTLLLALTLLSSFGAMAQSSSCKLEAKAKFTMRIQDGSKLQIETPWNRSVKEEAAGTDLEDCLAVASVACDTDVFIAENDDGSTVIAQKLKKISVRFTNGAGLTFKTELSKKTNCEEIQ